MEWQWAVIALSVALWLVLGGLVSFVAAMKGYWWPLWGMLGLIFPVITLIVLAILPTQPRRPSES